MKICGKLYTKTIILIILALFLTSCSKEPTKEKEIENVEEKTVNEGSNVGAKNSESTEIEKADDNSEEDETKENEESEEIIYADDAFYKDAAKAFNNRQETIEKLDNDVDEIVYIENILELNKDELESVKKYKDFIFEDSKLKENVLKYINSLSEILEIRISDLMNNQETQKLYDTIRAKRGEAIKYFNESDIYSSLIKEKYKSHQTEVIENSEEIIDEEEFIKNLEEKVKNLKFKKGKGEFGTTYTSIFQNDLNRDLENVSIHVVYRDEDDVIVEDDYVYINDLSIGDKYKIELIPVEKFKRIELSLEKDF